MNNVEKVQPHISALEDTDLEQISGGMDLNDVTEFRLNQTAFNALLGLFKNDINSLEDQIRYADVINTLETYDRSSKPWSEKCRRLAASWNKGNKCNIMTPEIAGAGLQIKDPISRAKFFSLSPDKMQEALAGA